MSRLDFLLLPYFAYIENFTKFTRESFLFNEKSLLMENQKRKKVVGEKKKKKNKKKKKTGLKEERKSTNLSKKREYLSVKKRKRTSLVKVTGTGGAPCWRPDFEQRSRRQTKIYHT